MPTLRFRIQEIESKPLSVDARNFDKTSIIDGKNYLFDSMGPKSGFSTRQLTPFAFPDATDIQGLRLQNGTFVFTPDSILQWRKNVPYAWDVVHDFKTKIPVQQRDPWSGIYFAGDYFFSHRYRGFLKGSTSQSSGKLQFLPQTTATIPGLIAGIRGMAVVQGRAIIVNDSTIQWSAPLSLDSLAIGLGGAGFQLINEFVAGTYLALTTFESGFVVWTTEGAVAAEHIGGDAVWRWFPLTTEEKPIGNWTTLRLSNGKTVFLGIHGLMVLNAAAEPTPWTQDFNEFFREYCRDRQINLHQWRLEYDVDREYIYLMESANGVDYWRTHVIAPTLNKWGELSDKIHGVLPLTEELFGYVDQLRIPQYFINAHDREIEPPNELGLNRLFPRVQKNLLIPSSSAVCNAIAWNPEYTFPIPDLVSGGWFEPGVELKSAAVTGPMDSWIEIGYIRPAEYNAPADANFEIQELIIGSIPSAAPVEESWITEWKPNYFYDPVEDWDDDIILIPGDFTDDLMIGDSILDLNAASGDSDLDFNVANYPTFIDSSDHEDWNNTAISEDWMSPISGLPIIDYDLSIQGSGDGITFDLFTPVIARFNTAALTYSVETSGNFHRIRFDAVQQGHYFHVKYAEVNVEYGGQTI